MSRREYIRKIRSGYSSKKKKKLSKQLKFLENFKKLSPISFAYIYTTMAMDSSFQINGNCMVKQRCKYLKSRSFCWQVTATVIKLLLLASFPSCCCVYGRRRWRRLSIEPKWESRRFWFTTVKSRVGLFHAGQWPLLAASSLLLPLEDAVLLFQPYLSC